MKTNRLAAVSIAIAAMLPMAVSCSSDKNPFDNFFTPTTNETAKIQLILNVASTRAGVDYSTDAEKKVSKVSVFIFDENDKLEKSVLSQSVASEDTPITVEVAPGMKTIYAISAKEIVEANVAAGTTIGDFEDIVFSAKPADLQTKPATEAENEFIMVGRSDKKMVFKSVNEDDMPASNLFAIELVRLVAKTQVKFDSSINADVLGLTIQGNPQFNVSQTCDKMRLKYNGTEISNPGYSVKPYLQDMSAVRTDFTKNNCLYISENIVREPKAANTTFVSLGISLKAQDFYTYNAYDGSFTSVPNSSDSNVTFYTVGRVDEWNGFEDITLHPQTKKVLTFASEPDATAYANALNGGAASALTMSEAEGPLKAPTTRAEGDSKLFQAIHFNGWAFYRINIKDEDGNLKVERNKFYKISVNSIKGLGYHDESLLRPDNPDASVETSSSAWVGAVFSVAGWDEENVGVDLE